MQTAPKGSCQIEAFNRAYSEMKLAMSKAGNAWYKAMGVDPSNPPSWVESALRQHALFHAVRVCAMEDLAGLGAMAPGPRTPSPRNPFPRPRY